MPVIKWAGGKRSLAPLLTRMAPSNIRSYYEPFVGSGALFFSLGTAKYTDAIISDINRSLIDLYVAIRDEPDSVMAALDILQPHVLNKDRYYQIRGTNECQLTLTQRAARFIYLNKAGYNGLYRVNRAGEFNVPFGRHPAAPRLYEPRNLLRVSKRLQMARLVCGDFDQTLADAGTGDFAYLDPPYAPLTSTANFTSYTNTSFTKDDQIRLATAVHALTEKGTRVLLSNSDVPLVRDLYKDYNLTVLYAARRINSDSGGRGKITELSIRNYAST